MFVFNRIYSNAIPKAEAEKDERKCYILWSDMREIRLVSERKDIFNVDM